MELEVMERSTLEKVLNELPYETKVLKKAISNKGIMSSSMVHKWYKGDAKVTDIETIKALVTFLNDEYPPHFGLPLKLEDFTS